MGIYSIKVIILSHDHNYKNLLSRELRLDTELDVIATPFNLLQASTLLLRNKHNALIIDVSTQDITEAHLRKLREEFSITIIIVGYKSGINYIQIGIKDVIHKPIGTSPSVWGVYARDIIKRMKNCLPAASSSPTGVFVAGSPFSADKYVGDSGFIVAIASSTGGTEALADILVRLPADMPPVLIVQHMPSGFTRLFADRLDKICKIKVKEAANGEFVKMGTAYIAPGDFHMTLCKNSSKFSLDVSYGEKAHAVRPSADVMFSSIVKVANCKKIVGVILTGMGADGAKGLYELHLKGSKVIAQNKETCVVYGMPKVAVDLGAADFVLPLNTIADKMIQLTR